LAIEKMELELDKAMKQVPGGAWAAAVSGGADSVALLTLLNHREDVRLHVVHLNHELRGDESRGDAQFVRTLADSLQIPCTIARLGEMATEKACASGNPSAKYRAARLALYRRVVREHQLDGVILAHHADDQAETVLLRLLRGAGPRGLAGMSVRTQMNGLFVLRPMLGVDRQLLRHHLQTVGVMWREDSSNATPVYARNRVRRLLDARPELKASLLELADAMRELKDWTREAAPELEDEAPIERLASLPDVLAEESAYRWLANGGAPAAKIDQAALDRLVEMARDAGTASRQHFPGRVLVSRRKGKLRVDSKGATNGTAGD
jgi:tRNA(Ile)-lysidine synthetase-like protein